jgi:hypothetical protein
VKDKEGGVKHDTKQNWERMETDTRVLIGGREINGETLPQNDPSWWKYQSMMVIFVVIMITTVTPYNNSTILT